MRIRLVSQAPNETQSSNPSHPATRVRYRARAGLLAVTSIVVALSVAACGGSPGSSDPTPSSAAAGQGGGSQTSTQGSLQAFAACMRSHGVGDFPDPDGSGHMMLSGDIQNNPNFQPAMQACQSQLPNGGTNAGGGGSNDAALKFAQCMRAHGITQFPDPTNGAVNVPPSIDRNSPQFQAAQQACRSNLGQGGQQP